MYKEERSGIHQAEPAGDRTHFPTNYGIVSGAEVVGCIKLDMLFGCHHFHKGTDENDKIKE